MPHGDRLGVGGAFGVQSHVPDSEPLALPHGPPGFLLLRTKGAWINAAAQQAPGLLRRNYTQPPASRDRRRGPPPVRRAGTQVPSEPPGGHAPQFSSPRGPRNRSQVLLRRGCSSAAALTVTEKLSSGRTQAWSARAQREVNRLPGRHSSNVLS